MKVRCGFVSNSSSSSFVVFVPKDFLINDIVINKTLEKVTNSWTIESIKKTVCLEDGTFNEEGIDKLNKMANELKDGGYLYKDEDYTASNALVEILKVCELVLSTIETGPDDGIISGLTYKDVSKLMEAINKKVWLQG